MLLHMPTAKTAESLSKNLPPYCAVCDFAERHAVTARELIQKIKGAKAYDRGDYSHAPKESYVTGQHYHTFEVS